MVEPLGTKTVLTVDRSTVAPVRAPVAPPRAAADAADISTVAGSAIAAQAAAASAAPIDTDRVAEIKAAIANGTFPILPAKIADAMIALRLDWNSIHEPQ